VNEHVSLVVNGVPREVDVEPRRLLVQLIREDLDLTGTHIGCDTSQCGTCTVLIDNQPILSCLTLGVESEGAEIVTVEGLARNGALTPLQEAFRRHHALQCGFCTPGILMAADDLLSRGSAPTRSEIVDMLSGQLCRCTGYTPIVDAIAEVARA